MIYYSFLNYKTNTYPVESVCVGMLYVDTDTGEHRFKVSKLKMDIAKRILPNKGAFKLFKMYVKSYSKAKWDLPGLDREHRLQNGLIKWSKPVGVIYGMDQFDLMFYKRIEETFIKK